MKRIKLRNAVMEITASTNSKRKQVIGKAG